MNIRITGQPEVATVNSTRAATAKSADTDAKSTGSVVSSDDSDSADVSKGFATCRVGEDISACGQTGSTGEPSGTRRFWRVPPRCERSQPSHCTRTA